MTLNLSRTSFFSLTWAAPVLFTAFSAVAEPRAPLSPEARTNGSGVSDALAPLREDAVATVARFLDSRGKTIVTGTCLGKDGYFVTKASELPNVDKARLLLPDGRMTAMREVRRDAGLDLVLVHAIEGGDMKAVDPVPGGNLIFGQWVTSLTRDGSQFCIGVVSAQKRQIKGFGAALGVRMDDDATPKNGGVRITGIAEDGPAALAGLEENDILLSVAGEKVGKYQRVHEIMTTRQPGDEVEVRFRRDGKERKVTVRLASRTKVLNNWEGEDFANGGVSVRTDNFSQVLQHDLPLAPQDMGGPLLTLDGRVVGINIARVDRVTTFALPTEVFLPTVKSWIEADRHPPKAVAPAMAVTAEAAEGRPPEPGPRGPRATLHQAR